MRPLKISLNQKIVGSLLVSLAGLGYAGCSSNENGSDNPGAGTGTTTPQAGTGTTTPQAGSSSGGSASPAAGTSSSASGSGSNGTAGTSTSAGASSTAGASSMGGTSSTAGTGSGGANGGGGGASGGSANGGTGGSVDVSKLDKFSFFVTSMAGLQKLSKSQNGFGGDLRYGTADGLTGADKICTELAESSMPGSSAKQWRAFLSTTKVNAKDRIGTGPWYDRIGRLVSQDMAGLLKERPDADPAIKNDLPNETGTGNHRPNPNAPEDDNHHTLTGSNGQGTLFSMTATCKDWTTTSMNNATTGDGVGRPKTGFSWSVANRTQWIDGQLEGGCGAGVTGVGSENGGSDPSNPIVGSGGGYGGFYCFALVP